MQLEDKLRKAFAEYPLVDGINHPAELIVDEALAPANGKRFLAELRKWSLDIANPGFASSVLRCLGRTNPGTSAWRIKIVRSALNADDVEVRDAAVQAAESWGDPEILGVLENHVEAIPWLRDYIEDVVDDLKSANRPCPPVE